MSLDRCLAVFFANASDKINFKLDKRTHRIKKKEHVIFIHQQIEPPLSVCLSLYICLSFPIYMYMYASMCSYLYIYLI